MKQYDRRYFDTWYRQRGIGKARSLSRKVAVAVSTAEYHLARPLRTVLDVGCGEGVWRAPVRRYRPDVFYLGLDSSKYAIARFGRARNLRLGRFGDLAGLRFDTPFDLLVCADVLHYLDDAEVRRGLGGIADLCHGIAFIEVYTSEDDIEGDLEGFRRRSSTWYRKAFMQAGLVPCGTHCYATPACAEQAAALELALPCPTTAGKGHD